MDDRTRFGINKNRHIKSFKGQGNVEDHDYLRHEGTRYIKKDLRRERMKEDMRSDSCRSQSQ